jgi:hypothetical protein
LAVYLKSDLKIPESFSKFISLYLLFAIGFKGGQELSHEAITMEIAWSMGFGIFISLIVEFHNFIDLSWFLYYYEKDSSKKIFRPTRPVFDYYPFKHPNTLSIISISTHYFLFKTNSKRRK